MNTYVAVVQVFNIEDENLEYLYDSHLYFLARNFSDALVVLNQFLAALISEDDKMIYNVLAVVDARVHLRDKVAVHVEAIDTEENVTYNSSLSNRLH